MDKDLKKLIEAVLKWSEMPQGPDIVFGAEKMVPLAAKLKNKYFKEEQ